MQTLRRRPYRKRQPTAAGWLQVACVTPTLLRAPLRTIPASRDAFLRALR